MKECVFCNIVKIGNNNNEKEKNVILYEDDLVLITQATGSPVRGYIINAPRSIFMNLIAKQINLKLPYEWRNNVTKKEYIDEIIEIFNDNKNFLKNI